MKNHTLMQAIARANRVFRDKPAGFIVDYINVFRNLKKALAIYASPSATKVDMPIETKDMLVGNLRQLLNELDSFLISLGIHSNRIISSSRLDKNTLLNEAVGMLVTNDQIKNSFLTKAGAVLKIYRAILPHPKSSQFTGEAALYDDLVKEIRSLDPEVDISGVMRNIEHILDQSIMCGVCAGICYSG
jgi:type I restriction enzyme R subunit